MRVWEREMAQIIPDGNGLWEAALRPVWLATIFVDPNCLILQYVYRYPLRP